jgi:hypothetical protein
MAIYHRQADTDLAPSMALATTTRQLQEQQRHGHVYTEVDVSRLTPLYAIFTGDMWYKAFTSSAVTAVQ